MPDETAPPPTEKKSATTTEPPPLREVVDNPPSSWLRTILLLPIFVSITVLYAIITITAGAVFSSRKWIARATGDWATDVLRVCGVRVRVIGAENIADGVPSFFVSNHQSALDIPILVHLLRGQVRFMAKRELFSVPFFGWAITAARYIPVDRNNSRKALRVLKERFAEYEKDPISILVFPEGTRSADGAILPFRKGTMKICQYSKLRVIPMSIEGSLNIHRTKALRVNPGEVRVTFGKPIPAEVAAKMRPLELMNMISAIVHEQMGQTPAEVPKPAPVDLVGAKPEVATEPVDAEASKNAGADKAEGSSA